MLGKERARERRDLAIPGVDEESEQKITETSVGSERYTSGDSGSRAVGRRFMEDAAGDNAAKNIRI
jgi:hypothetical protein